MDGDISPLMASKSPVQSDTRSSPLSCSSLGFQHHPQGLSSVWTEAGAWPLNLGLTFLSHGCVCVSSGSQLRMANHVKVTQKENPGLQPNPTHRLNMLDYSLSTCWRV